MTESQIFNEHNPSFELASKQRVLFSLVLVGPSPQARLLQAFTIEPVSAVGPLAQVMVADMGNDAVSHRIARYNRLPNCTSLIAAVSKSSGGLAVVISPSASQRMQIPAATSL